MHFIDSPEPRRFRSFGRSSTLACSSFLDRVLHSCTVIATLKTELLVNRGRGHVKQMAVNQRQRWANAILAPTWVHAKLQYRAFAGHAAGSGTLLPTHAEWQTLLQKPCGSAAEVEGRSSLCVQSSFTHVLCYSVTVWLRVYVCARQGSLPCSSDKCDLQILARWQKITVCLF